MNKLRIESDEQNPLLLHFYWDDDWVKSAYKSLFINYLKALQACVEKEEFLAKFQEIEARVARKEGLRLLARKGYFGSELKQKLILKGISDDTADQVVQHFEQKGYIHDGNRGESIVRRELKKGHGSQYIFQMLKHKKVSSDEIAKLRPLIEKEEKQCLYAYLQKHSSALLRQDRRKLVTKLLRRGYSHESILDVIGFGIN